MNLDGEGGRKAKVLCPNVLCLCHCMIVWDLLDSAISDMLHAHYYSLPTILSSCPVDWISTGVIIYILLPLPSRNVIDPHWAISIKNAESVKMMYKVGLVLFRILL
jgi:hypothetical protein